MFEIVVSVALYLGALVLLVKGAIAYCNHDRVYEKAARTTGITREC